MKKIIVAIAVFCAIGAGAHAQSMLRTIWGGFSKGMYPNCNGGGGMCLTPTFPQPQDPFPFSVLLGYTATGEGNGTLNMVFEAGVEGYDKVNSSLNFTEDTQIPAEIAQRLKVAGRLFIKMQNKNGQARKDESGNLVVSLACYQE